MPFSDWPTHTRCPACLQVTGEFLPAVSIAAANPHYRCTACRYTWIPDAELRDLRQRAEQARAKVRTAVAHARRAFRKAKGFQV